MAKTRRAIYRKYARIAAVQKLLLSIGPPLLRMWMGSVRVTAILHCPSALPMPISNQRGYIFAGWHESMLLTAYRWAKYRPYTIISNSNDGDLASRMAIRMGRQVARGSSSKGAIAGLWDVLDELKKHDQSHFFVTADGPRGPWRQFKSGAIYLASKTGRRLVLAGVAYDRPWRVRSWDHFVLPRPFSTACVVIGKPIEIPHDVNRKNIDHHQRYIQTQIDRLQGEADARIAGLNGTTTEPIGLPINDDASGESPPNQGMSGAA